MLKKFIQISSLVGALAVATLAPANAASEEDAAAPAGSFTSTMHVPHGAGFEDRRWRHERFAMRFDGAGSVHAARHYDDGQR